MKTRGIKSVVSAEYVNMDGFIVMQPLPVSGLDQIDPFLLVHHAKPRYEAGADQRLVGVGPHPHRGFAPITFVFDGGVHHRDSMNNNRVVESGGIQYMMAGSGVIHSERPSPGLLDEGGTMEIIQFWLNVPAVQKMNTPVYIPVDRQDLPGWTSENKKARIGLLSGDFASLKGAVETPTPTLIMRMDFEEGGALSIPIDEGFNALVYVLDGELSVNGSQSCKGNQMCFFDNEGHGIELTAHSSTRAILLSGQPINEDVQSYGPFVMNTQAQIMGALRDYQAGRMGYLVEEFD